MASQKDKVLGSLCSCPICERSFPKSEIENHVDRCIFLNTEESPTSANKRSCSQQSGLSPTSQTKRLKTDDSVSCSKTEFENQAHVPVASKNVPKVELRTGTSVPLAETMRPSDLVKFVGQEHVLGQDKVLRTLLDKQEIPSMIFWGPPGCGKTTLAHIIATRCRNNQQSVRFVKLSATMSGVNDVKDVVKIAINEMKNFKRQTILFMDEIHRFNKLQQDIFLPHVESGTLTLIGATTENPSFSLNNALLSRCRVIVLEKLGTEHLMTILRRALEALDVCVVKSGKTEPLSGIKSGVVVEEEAVQWLAEMCDGDARIALNSLQLAINSKTTSDGKECLQRIVLNDIQEGVKRSHLLYDRKGDQHYDIISAVHKSIRASDENAALYWVTRMIEGGEDPRFIARRLVRAASEDIGLADPSALPLAVSVMQGCQLLGMPESDVLLAQCAIYLARAPKSREADSALARAKECIANHKGPQPSVPLHLRNAPTRLMKDLGYGKGYNMKRKEASNLTYMPEGIEDVDFFH